MLLLKGCEHGRVDAAAARAMLGKVVGVHARRAGIRVRWTHRERRMLTEYASRGRAVDGPELGVMLAKKVGARPGESPLGEHTSAVDFRR